MEENINEEVKKEVKEKTKDVKQSVTAYYEYNTFFENEGNQ